MVWLSTILGLIIICQAFYIKRLYNEVQSYRRTWDKIEDITDHNQEGDLIIHIRKADDST